jgi:hypothetical protein
MSTTPDKWILIKITKKDGEPFLKVLAVFYGGYLQGDSWRINSGVEKEIEFDDRYEFVGYSGSKYICFKDREGMTMYMHSIYSMLKDQLEFFGGSLERVIKEID